MEKIYLQKAIPVIFKNKLPEASGIWEKEVHFTKGALYLLEAASGKGKTSFCSYIYGHRDDYAGEIRFDEQDIRSFSPETWGALRRESLGILFQGLRLFPELTAWENVQLKNRLTHFKTDEWIRTAFERLNIADKLEAPVAKISFGQQQRVALIRALCQPLDFILLDEPVSHLDDTNNRYAGELLLEEVSQQGCGVISTSIGKHLDLPYHQTLQL